MKETGFRRFIASSRGVELGVSVLHDDWSPEGVLAQLATDGCPMGSGKITIQGWPDTFFKVISEDGNEIHFSSLDGQISLEEVFLSPKQWICCGVNLIEICRRACTSLPERCFFCGAPRIVARLDSQPEDPLALELAELWCAKIREQHGDPNVHGVSLDEYGRADIEAWRAVARRMLELKTTTS